MVPINMFDHGPMGRCCGLKDKFKISKVNEGDKLTITFAGDKNDIEKLEKKMDAFETLASDCCGDKGC